VISVNIIKVLGEGGFSFVYLAQDETSGVRDLMGFSPRHHLTRGWHTRSGNSHSKRYDVLLARRA
jgi:serine/threonine protein kinase